MAFSSRCVLFAVGLFVVALPASATDISGRWSFQTGKYADMCIMSGSMTISSPSADGKYQCQFVTRENCGAMQAEVEQECSVSRDGAKVTIRSRITNIRMMEPAEYGYAPDHWNLTIISAEEMTGFLESYHDARARFFRSDVPVT